MERNLNHFTIGDSYGSNQDWFSNFLMKMGGCAAVTACDSCIYFAREFGMRELYPFEPQALSREDFVAFGMQMKPYLKPRTGGISKLGIYEEGFSRYLRDKHSQLKVDGFAGEHSLAEATAFVKMQIDRSLPIPYLLLKHRNAKFKDFTWHWFLLTGYEETKTDMLVTTATYGMARKFSMAQLWDTGCLPLGGMIKFTP